MAGTKMEDMMIISEEWQDLEGNVKIEATAQATLNSGPPYNLNIMNCRSFRLCVHICVFSITYILPGNANLKSERNPWGSCL